MAEGGDNDGTSNANTNMSGLSGPNVKGGPSTGTTRLTDSSHTSTNQSCQC